MKPMIALGLVLMVLVAGILWLATAPAMPPVQKIEQVLPDDHIPH